MPTHVNSVPSLVIYQLYVVEVALLPSFVFKTISTKNLCKHFSSQPHIFWFLFAHSILGLDMTLEICYGSVNMHENSPNQSMTSSSASILEIFKVLYGKLN